MADEILRSRHAFGSSQNLESAISAGKIDAYDILFLDSDTDPKIGWLDKNGDLVLVKDEKADLTEVKAGIDNLESGLSDLGIAVDKKANADEVDAKINESVTEAVDSANAYTDEKLEAALAEHLVKKYEISNTPEGTLVDYRESEIRVMCPEGSVFTKQNVGSTGNANMYYMAFKAYAPKGAVSFKEGDRGVIIDEMFTFDSEFAGTDEHGRNYSVCWLALASCDASGTWTYFGKNSTTEKYIGWDYVVEWFDADGVIIASDGIRINLSNEDCHFVNEPYYIGKIMKEVDTKIEEKIAEVEAAWEIVEF